MGWRPARRASRSRLPALSGVRVRRDETEVGVLFDRRDPASLLWPDRQTLKAVLQELNKRELSKAWDKDEDQTIGWLYQYFNSKKERDKMRRNLSRRTATS